MVNGYIYFSELERGEEKNRLLDTLTLWINAFENYDFTNEAHAQEWLDMATGGFGKYLKLIRQEEGELSVELHYAKIEELIDKYGYHIILSHGHDYTAEQVIEICHGRDPIEKLWRTMKTGLDSKTLKTRLDDTTHGQIFIVWGAAILHNLLLNRMQNFRLCISVGELMMALRKIRLEIIGQKIIPKTLTATAKNDIVSLELETLFPEFHRELKELVEKRKNEKVAADKPRKGRPPKFPKKKILKNNSGF